MQELRLRTSQRVEFVVSMRVEGGVKLFQRPFVATDTLAHVIFRFEMEHRRLCLKTPIKNKTERKGEEAEERELMSRCHQTRPAARRERTWLAWSHSGALGQDDLR